MMDSKLIEIHHQIKIHHEGSYKYTVDNVQCV